MHTKKLPNKGCLESTPQTNQATRHCSYPHHLSSELLVTAASRPPQLKLQSNISLALWSWFNVNIVLVAVEKQAHSVFGSLVTGWVPTLAHFLRAAR